MIIERHKVILDCDNSFGRFGCDIDDALALLYLLGRDDVDLLGVTSVFGNTRVEHVVRITNTLLERLGYGSIPVLRGAAGAGDHQTEAARFLAQSAARYSGRLAVVATGPLTNLAGAAQSDGNFFQNLKSVTCMGGYHRPVRIGLRPAGEINISADPIAVARVFHGVRPVSLFTTEVCLQASIGLLDLWRLSFLDAAIRLQMATWLASYGLSRGLMRFYLWDVLPAIAATHPSLFDRRSRRAPTRISDLQRGYIVDEAGDDIDMPSRITDLDSFNATVQAAWACAAPATPHRLKVKDEIDVGAPIDDVFALGEGSFVTSANN